MYQQYVISCNINNVYLYAISSMSKRHQLANILSKGGEERVTIVEGMEGDSPMWSGVWGGDVLFTGVTIHAAHLPVCPHPPPPTPHLQLYC